MFQVPLFGCFDEKAPAGMSLSFEKVFSKLNCHYILVYASKM